jgi:hypothetical protein
MLGSAAGVGRTQSCLGFFLTQPRAVGAVGRGFMSGKYSAQWWEKVADSKRDFAPVQDSPSIAEPLVEATTAARRPRSRHASGPDMGAAGGARTREPSLAD